MMPGEPQVSYTAEASAVGYGPTPDMAIDELLAETQNPWWGKWWIFGIIKLSPITDADDRAAWEAEATMQRTVEVEI